MKTLLSLKKDIEFNKGLAALLETLKAIAVSQYRALEQRIKSFEEFTVIVENFFDFVDTKGVSHPFFNPGNKPQAIVAVTSDAGLLGGLNMQVIEAAFREAENTSTQLIVIGERGRMYVSGSKIPSISFPGIKDEDRYEQAMKLRDYIFDKVLTGTFSAVKVIYPHPISFTVQRVETVSFLPYSLPSGTEVAKVSLSEVIMESTLANLIEYLVYLRLGRKLYEIFGLSRLAEFAARFVHLEESVQKLADLTKKVKLEYFRVRHEIIDCTMRELFAGRAIYSNR